MTRQSQELNEPDLAGNYTARDYLRWTFEGMVELIRGRIYKMSPAPRIDHQKCVGKLYTRFDSFFAGRPCEVFLSPVDVYLVTPGQEKEDTGNVVQPDLVIVCDNTKVRELGIVGSPDMVIEVLSPSTAKKDASAKLELYQEFGIREYWMVSYREKLIFDYVLNKAGKYEIKTTFTDEGVASPAIFPEIKIELSEIFSGLLEA